MRLAKWRREKGLTQEQLAAQLECTQPYVSALERSADPRIPSADVMIRVYIVTRGAVTLEDMAFPGGLPDFDTGELPLAPAPAPLLDVIHGNEQAEDRSSEAQPQAAAA